MFKLSVKNVVIPPNTKARKPFLNPNSPHISSRSHIKEPFPKYKLPKGKSVRHYELPHFSPYVLTKVLLIHTAFSVSAAAVVVVDTVVRTAGDTVAHSEARIPAVANSVAEIAGTARF
jgi:hypothetical protein